MGLKFPPGYEVDHKNRDGLDNQRGNLRAVTHSVNQHNRDLYRNNRTGVSGVTWYKQRGQWIAKIQIQGRRTCLGYFDRFEDAVAARLKAEERHFGGEYTTNLPGPAIARSIEQGTS